MLFLFIVMVVYVRPVSYTHLDVYKRQKEYFMLTTRELQDEIIRLKKEKDICILAHAYQSHDIWEDVYKRQRSHGGYSCERGV